MAGSLSKRQQARNERALQELIKSIPGNDVCADCGARNPGWASWSLGIFLCMRCAGLHRKLGTHISKVKSLSMDSWGNEQVENMKRLGNTASNRVYNPQNTKPPIPFDVDEADSAMERFIRQKYQEVSMQGGRARAPVRHDTGSTESDDHPPPLPPKSSSKFGFRSASSIFPMSSKAKREAAARAHLEVERNAWRSPSPPIRNKPSRVFGAAVSSERSTTDDLDSKLATLHQMGFTEEKRNTTVLRGVNGNLEKAVETLIKQGDSAPASRSRTPLSATAGITIQRTREKDSPKPSKNPFDLPSPLPPQSSQSTGAMANPKENQQMNGNHFHHPHPTNPFGLAPSQSQYSLHQQYLLDQSFQNMSLGQSQPLFPNHTGGFPDRQPFQQAAASRMPTIPQDYTPAVFDGQQHQQSPTSPLNPSYNPFLHQQAQQQQQPPQPQGFNQPASNAYSGNPYVLQQRAQTFPQHVYYDQTNQQQQAYYDPNPQMQNQQQFQQSQQMQNPHQFQQLQPTQQQTNPFGLQPQQNQQPAQPQQPEQQQINPFGFQPQQTHQSGQPQQQYMQYQPQPQQLMPQQTGRADKSSILALYNYPQLAPQVPSQPQSPTEQNQYQNLNNQNYKIAQAQTQQQRSVSSPLASFAAASRNPFMTSGGGLESGAQAGNRPNGMSSGVGGGQARHVSQESMSVDVGGWHGQNGRHSPDAFANLSARSMR